MGISDRDYYRDQHRLLAKSGAGRLAREHRWRSNGGMVFVWIVVLATVVVIAMRVLKPEGAASSGVTTQWVVTSSTTSGSAPASRAAPATPPVNFPPPSSATSRTENASPIYRCGDAYGQSPCTGARIVQGPAASGFDSRPSEKLERLVAAGRIAQSDGDVTNVTRTFSQNGVVVNDPVAARNVECQGLAVEVDAIDRTTRQPLSKPQQDHLRGQRQIARDRQARLHC